MTRATLIGVVVAWLAVTLASFLVPLDPRLGVLVWLVWPVAFAALGTVIWIFAIPPRVRAAYAAFSWLGRWEIERFRSLTGSKVPTSEAAVRQWLAEHPTPGFGGYARMEMLAMAGEFERARQELGRFGPPADTADAAERLGLAAWLDQMETGHADPGPFQAAVAALPAGPGRLRSEVAFALLETRQRLESGRADWPGPLADVRPHLGHEPTLVVARDTLARLFVMQFLVAIAVGGAGLLVTTIL